MQYIYLFLLPILLGVFLCLLAINPVLVLAQSDRQTQLVIKQTIEQGNILMSKQLFKEALSEYERCLRTDPNNATARANIVLLHDNWGVYYFRHNQYQDAQIEWETALRLNPNDSKAKSNMLVLKNTLAKLGLDINTESTMINQQKRISEEKQKAGEESAVVILGTHKNKPAAEENNNLEQYYSKGSGTANGTINKPAINQTEERTQTSLVDEQLNRIEHKVYGRSLDELPITKRLEKLETDSFGQVSTSPIIERLQKLKQLYDKN